KPALCRLFAKPTTRSPGVENQSRPRRDPRAFGAFDPAAAVDNDRRRACSILADGAFAPLSPISRHTPHLEADLPAERASPEAPARLPCTDGDPRGTRDPQAAARERAQAPLRLTRPLGSRIDVQRRHRLSRSRDFDAVYRHGRSVATRFLVLYAFARDDGGPPRIR